MSRRIGLRGRLTLSVIGSVAVVLVVLIGAFNMVLRSRLNADANNALFARASGELASLRVSGNQLRAPEVPDAAALDTQTWVFAGQRAVEHPRASAQAARLVKSMTTGGLSRRELASAHTRFYAVPVLAGGRRLGTVVAQESLIPYENTADTALIASIVLGTLVLVLVAVASRFLISGALRPVASMTAQAAAWSEVDADRRFDMGPARDELSQLAATLDRLLDRVASSLRHEQRFSAELSHELRSPLASVMAEAQYALRHSRSSEELRVGYERILASAQQMARTLETLVTAARVELDAPLGTGDAASAAQAAAAGCAELAARNQVDVRAADPREPIRLGVDTQVAERVLAPLLENGCRHASSIVTVGIERQDGGVLFTVDDDGPGIAPEDLEHIFRPGWSGNPANGTGLGLPLARRLARAAGGDVEVSGGATAPGDPEVEGDVSGARFTVRLPAA
jgi:two-component system OmpR family sensor kinase